MPPHGHHHGGHGHHGGGGGFPGPWYGGGWGWDSAPIEVFTVQDTTDTDKILRFIATLPKNQRAAAYMKFFGKPAPQGMLGDFSFSLQSGLLVGLAIGAVYFLFIRKR